MPIVSQSAALMAYLPDWSEGKREPDRDFLWTLITNVQPNYAKKLMGEALRVRAKQQLEAKQPKR